MNLRRQNELLAGLFVFLYLPIAYYQLVLTQSGIAVDFPSYYHAARMAFIDDDTPYGFGAFRMASLAMGRKVHPYLYPPASLLAFWPLAYMPVRTAQTVFMAVGDLCYLGSLWLILMRLMPRPADGWPRLAGMGLAIVYVLSFDPALTTFYLGQVNFIALLFLCLALAGIRGDAPGWRIALPLSIAILLKTYPVLLLIPLLFRKRFGTAGLTAGFFGLYTAAAAIVLPIEVWTSWWKEVVPAAGYANNQISAAFVWNQSINGFVTRLLVPSEFCPSPLNYPRLAKAAVTLLALAAFGLTVFCSFRIARRREYERYGDVEIAIYLLMIFLIAPLSWDHHLVFVLPAIVLAIGAIADGSAGGKAALAVTAALFVMAWKFPLEDPALMQGWRTLLISVKFYGAVVLWVFLMSRLRKPLPAGYIPSTAPPIVRSGTERL